MGRSRRGGDAQDKRQEVRFFDEHAKAGGEYNVFTEETNRRITEAFERRCALSPGARVLDLGCGSGVFTARLAARGLEAVGVDLSPGLIELASRSHPGVDFRVGDAESLEFADRSFDAVFLGGVVHHFPRPARLVQEVARVLREGGTVFTFDPNRRNPFMYLYRDPSSPFYSSKGVTPNERPVLVEEVLATFRDAGIELAADYMSVQYTYVASPLTRLLLPAFNALESALFRPRALGRWRAFLVCWGKRAEGGEAA